MYNQICKSYTQKSLFSLFLSCNISCHLKDICSYARLCPPMPAYARLCPPMPAYARLCPSMPVYARLCPPMPAYARLLLNEIFSQ